MGWWRIFGKTFFLSVFVLRYEEGRRVARAWISSAVELVFSSFGTVVLTTIGL